jgi:multidrug efflux pump subunit AcrB
VVMVSLLLSWVTAVSVTPLLCVMFLKPSANNDKDASVDPYDSGFYVRYKGFLATAIRMKFLTIAVVAGLFASALWGFGYVDKSFFPPSTKPQFMVDIWMPQGTRIDVTEKRVEEIEQYLQGLEGVTHISSLLGKGGLRFLLTYAPEKLNSAYAQLLVDVESSELLDSLTTEVEQHLNASYGDMLTYASKFQLGPGSTGKIQARLSGPDRDVLRELASRVMDIYRADPDSKGIRTNWRERVKLIRPVMAEEQANLSGITRQDIAKTLLESFQGRQVGVFRDRDLLLPIIIRAEERERTNLDSIKYLQIWSPAAQAMIPLRQVVSGFATVFEDEIIERRNRKPTITVYADPEKGLATSLFERVAPQVEALELPPGYELEWGGEYEDSRNAQAGLSASMPVFFLSMVLITIMLFNSLKQPLIIWLTVPLAVIGVTAGLLVTGQPFGFMALLGMLSLSGMLIKNAIVLIDEINLQRKDKPLLQAIIDSGASRLRPVGMAASTTALGMIPLLFDAFFIAMAITIIAGLMFATLLTMVVVPVLYAAFYKEAAT